MARSLQLADAPIEQGGGVSQGGEHVGPWLSPRQALTYIPCKSLGALRKWCQRHGIVRGFGHSIAKADIDRIRKERRRRVRRPMHANSLRNLRRVAGR